MRDGEEGEVGNSAGLVVFGINHLAAPVRGMWSGGSGGRQEHKHLSSQTQREKTSRSINRVLRMEGGFNKRLERHVTTCTVVEGNCSGFIDPPLPPLSLIT